MKIDIPSNLQKLAKIFSKKTDLFIVGGYIRDKILGLESEDIDVCGALTVLQLQKLLASTKYTLKDMNKKLGTAKIVCDNEIYEYSTFRNEIYSQNGSHSPVQVEFIRSVKQDSKRRDFTVNCIYYNINKDEILDFYNGLEDIKRKKIRCIEDANLVFANDGLRILRMVRQASQLNFNISTDTLLVAKRLNFKLYDISNQRKLDELLLMLGATKNNKRKPNIKKGLSLFNYLGLWKFYFDDVDFVKYKIVKKLERDQRFIGLLIDLIYSTKPDCISYYLEHLLANLGLPKTKISKDIEVVCGYFDALNMLNNKDYFFRYFTSFEHIAKILEKSSPFVYRKYNFFYKYIIKYKVPIQIKDLKINGNDIKSKCPKIAEKKYKYILTDLLNKVFRAELDNDKDCLINEVKKYEN